MARKFSPTPQVLVDGAEVDLAEDDQAPQPVKLWARRVWTLERGFVRGNPTSCRNVSLTSVAPRFDLQSDTLNNLCILP